MGKYAIKIANGKISACQEITKNESPVGYAVLSNHSSFVYFDEYNKVNLYLTRANSAVEAKIATQDFLRNIDQKGKP